MFERGIFRKQHEVFARRRVVMDSLDKPFYSVAEAAKHLGRRKEDVYSMIAAGDLDAVEVGKKGQKRIPKAALARVLVPGPFDLVRKASRERPQ